MHGASCEESALHLRRLAPKQKTYSYRIVLVLRGFVYAPAKSFARLLLASLLFASLIFANGCGRHRSVRVPTPPPARIGETETGIASWYGIPYNGRRAASGEIYDMEQLTAAHRTLPFQTWVKVTNLTNGKQVDVRITDRGPFVNGRIIDLSFAAAREIDMVRSGTARVRIKVIAPPPSMPPSAPTRLTEPTKVTGGFAVQAGAFSDRDRAEALRTLLAFPDTGSPQVASHPFGTFWSATL